MSHSCRVCWSSYDGEEKKPLVLPCGHTFCKSCVTRLGNEGYNVCPSCRKRSTTNVSDLPINYQLLEYSDQETNISPQFLCKFHSKHLYIMCRTCDTLVCWQCVNLTHLDCDFDVLNIRENFEATVEQDIQDTKKIGNERLGRYEELEKAVDKSLLEIEDLKVKLLELKKSISGAGSNLKNDLESLDDYKGSVNCLSDEQFLKQGFSCIQKVIYHKLSTVLPRLDAELITKLSALLSELSDSLDSLILPPVENYSFDEGKTWYLNSNESILATSKVLKDTSKRPSTLDIDVSSITDTTIVKRFLSNRSFGYSVNLTCFDESLTADENRQKLQDIIKRIGKEGIKKQLFLYGFVTLKTVKNLQEEFGDKVQMAQIGIGGKVDVDLLYYWNLTSARVLRSVNPNALKQCQSSISCLIFFPPLSDSDKDWLSAVIDKLFSASHRTSIYLKNSTLSRCGLDRLVGILKLKFKSCNVNLHLQSSLIPNNIKYDRNDSNVCVRWIK